MNLVNEYMNSNDKINFFRNLSIEEQQQLYKNLNNTEQKELLFLLPFQYIKNFIQTYPKEEQKDLYKKLNENQLKAIYNTLNQEEQKDFINALEERQADLLERMDRHNTNITEKSADIITSTNNIQASAINIANQKQELQQKKQEHKAVVIQLKKLEKERAKNLKRVLKASKSSPLDRIGIIAKYRTAKLLKRTQELEQTNYNINSLTDYKNNILQNIETAKETIIQEKQNIKDLKERIQQDKQSIHANTKALQETQVKIKKLSQTEKRVFGRKLYHQQLDKRDELLTRRKRNQTINIENISVQNTSVEPTIIQQEIPQVVNSVPESKVVETPTPEIISESLLQQPEQKLESPVEESPVVEIIDTPKENTQAQMQQILNQGMFLNNMGVNFYPALPLNPTQNASLNEDPITTISRNQAIIAFYALAAIYNYQQILAQQRMNQQNQELSEGYTRTLKKGDRGVISLAVLISILLFIFSLVLFFIK